MKKCAILFLAAAGSALAAGPALKISVLENDVLCVRAGSVTETFSAALHAAGPTNKISGMVLDLRFAGGDSPADAAGYFSRHPCPLVILVNSQTSGAAAALAAQLRAARTGVIIGSTNPPATVAPDITVAVSGADEKQFQENPLGPPAADQPFFLSESNNLLPFIDHMSEAELVRKRIKDGEEDSGSVAPANVEPGVPVIRDPALARAVDLLKAVAALHPARG